MPEVIDRRDRKAKKPHQCDLCGERIEKGEVYEWSKLKWEGTLYEFHEHKKCGYLAQELWDFIDPDDGLGDSEFQENLADFCRTFVCPDCPEFNREYGCERDESYCTDRAYEFLQTHELYRERRTPMGEIIWKCRPRGEA